MADITLSKPGQGQRQLLQSAAGSRIVLDFPASEATMEKTGPNLVFRFDDGSSVELENFYQQFHKDSMPEFQVDGQFVAGADFFNAFGPDLAPAAGPGGTAGGNRYHSYDNMNLGNGITHLNELDWGMQDGGEYTDTLTRPGDYTPYNGLLPTGITLSWLDPRNPGSPVDRPGDPDGGYLHGVTSNSVIFRLEESHLNTGSIQGTRANRPDADNNIPPVQAVGLLQIGAQNSDFTGLTIAGTFYSLADLASPNGVTIYLDMDDNGSPDVSMAFHYLGNGRVEVTVTLENNVDNSLLTHTEHGDKPEVEDVLAWSELHNALADLDIIAHNSANDTARVRFDVEVLDDTPEAYDDYQARAVEKDNGDNAGAIIVGNVVTGAGDQGRAGERTGQDLPGADGLAGVAWHTDNANTTNTQQDKHDQQDQHTQFYLVPGNAPNVFVVMDAHGDANGYHIVGEISLDPDNGDYEFKADIQYEPEHGNHTLNIPYTITDGDGDQAAAALHITIVNKNDRPEISVRPPDVNDPEPGAHAYAGTGDVKESGVYAPGEYDGYIHAAENKATQAGGVADGQHQVSVSGQLVASDADNDLLIFIAALDQAILPNGVRMEYADNLDGTWTIKYFYDDSASPNHGLAHGELHYGDLTVKAETGGWAFVLDDAAADHLGEGDKLVIKFPISVMDNSHADNDRGVDADIVITVHGTNDKPELTMDVQSQQGYAFEEGTDNVLVGGEARNISGNPTFTGQLTAVDPDDDDQGHLTFGFVLANNKVVAEMWLDSAGKLLDAAPSDGNYYCSFSMDAASGEYTISLNNGAQCVQALNDKDKPRFTINVAVLDSHGAYDTGSFSLTIQGKNDAPFIVSGLNGEVKENGVYLPAPNGDGNTALVDGGTDHSHHLQQISGKVLAADLDDPVASLAFAPTDEKAANVGHGLVADSWVFHGICGELVLLGDGTWTYTLDEAKANHLSEGDKVEEHFSVTVSDPQGATAGGVITIHVVGSNDRPSLGVGQSAYSFSASDADQSSTIYKNGGFVGTFNIVDPDDDGKYSVNDHETDNHRFELIHSGLGTIIGQTVSAAAHSENGGYGDTVTIKGTYGYLTVNLATGEYRYTLYPHPDHNQWGMEDRLLVDTLDRGDTYTETFTLKVYDLHDAYDEKTIDIKIFGEKTTPRINSFVKDVYEDGVKYWGAAEGVVGPKDGIFDADGKPLFDGPPTGPADGKPDIELDHTAPMTVSGNALLGAQLGEGTAAEHHFTWNSGQGNIGSSGAGTVVNQYGTFTANADGTYTFVLNNASDAVQSLRADDKTSFEVFYSYGDKYHAEVSGSVTVIIHGTNDAPVISRDMAAAKTIKEHGWILNVEHNEYPSTVGDAFTVHDPDLNDDRYLTVTFTDSWGQATNIQLPHDARGVLQDGAFTVGVQDPDTGIVIGTLTVKAQTLDGHDTVYSYEFTLDQVAADYLDQGQSLKYSLTYAIRDSGGEEITKTVAITVEGTNDRPVLNLKNPQYAFDEGKVLLGEASTSFSGTFQVTDPDHDGGLDNPGNTFSGDNGAHFTTAGGDLVVHGQYGTLTVHPDGTYEYVLDTEVRNNQAVLKIEGLGEGQQGKDHFDILVRDIHGTWSKPAAIDVVITGKNAEITVNTNEDGILKLKEAGVGVNASGSTHYDGDVAYTEKTAVAGINSASESGKFVIFDPDKSDVKHLILQIDGTKYDLGNGTKSGSVNTYTVATAYGSITIKGTAAADGVTSYSYTYALDNAKSATNKLSEGQIVTQNCVITVDDGHGSSVAHNFTVTIEGTNDYPVIASNSVASGTVKEDGVYYAGKLDFGDEREHTPTLDGGTGLSQHKITCTGKLSATDPDSDNDGSSGVLQLTFALTENHSTTVSSITNIYGTLVMQPDGQWTFVLDNSPGSAADKLSEGEKITSSFTATVTDNHGATVETTISITVMGSNDKPVLKINYSSVDLDENGHVYVLGDQGNHQALSGTLTWTDVDTKDMTAGHDIRISSTYTDSTGKYTTDAKTDLASSSTDNHLVIRGQYGTLTYDRAASNGTGSWTYELDMDLARGLPRGAVYEEKFTVWVRDQYGAWDKQELVIDVKGADESRIDLLALNPSQTVIEAGVVPELAQSQQYPKYVDYAGQPNAYGHIIGITNGNPDDLTYSVQDKDGHWHELGNTSDPAYDGSSWVIDAGHGTVVVTMNTEPGKGGYDYHYVLNNKDNYVDGLNSGERGHDEFWVMVEDKYGNKSEQPVNVSIVGTNDRPVFVLPDGQSTYIAEQNTNNPRMFSGLLDTRDPDTEDIGSSEVDAAHSYNLRVTGLIGVDPYDSDVDLDKGKTSSLVEVPGYGICSIKFDGSYTFTLSVEGLKKLQSTTGPLEILVPVRVTDPQGAYSNQIAVIILHETLAPPLLNPVMQNIEENGWTSAMPLVYANGELKSNQDYHATKHDSLTGNLQKYTSSVGSNHGAWEYKIDGGSGATHNFGNGQEACTAATNKYGTLYLAKDGRYEFVLDQDSPTVQQLRPGENPVTSFPVVVVDSTWPSNSAAANLEITVHGANDRPELGLSATHDGKLVNLSDTSAEFHGLNNQCQLTGRFDAEDWDNTVYRAQGDASLNENRGGKWVVSNTGSTPPLYAEENSEVVFCFLTVENGHVVPTQTLLTSWGSVYINADTGEYVYSFNVSDSRAVAALQAAVNNQGSLHDQFTVYARDAQGSYSQGFTVHLDLDSLDSISTGGTWLPPGGHWDKPESDISVGPNHIHEDGWRGPDDGYDPSEVVDGYTTHQSNRYDSNGDPAAYGEVQIQTTGKVGSNVEGRIYYFIDGVGNHVQSVAGMDEHGNIYGWFSINAVTGEYIFILNNQSDAVQRLDGGQVVDIVNVVIGCRDTKEGAAYYNTSSTVDLNFQIIGTSDRPSLHAENRVDETADQEANGAYGGQYVEGKLQGHDRDKNDEDNLTYKPTDAGKPGSNVTDNVDDSWSIHGKYGDLVMKADGSYTYTVHAGLNIPHGGYEESFKVTVTDDGDFAHNRPLSSEGSIVIHLHGENSAPTADVTSILHVREDAFNADELVFSDLGSVSNIFDYDGDRVSVQIGVNGGGDFGSYAIGQYGTLFLQADGTFYYQLNNDLLEIQQLKPANFLNEEFVVRLDDGHGGVTDKVVTVQIQGEEDKPLILLLGGEHDHVFGAGRSLDMLKTDAAGVHGKAIVIDIDKDDAVNAQFSLHGVGHATDKHNPYTEDDGTTWAWIQDSWQMIGNFTIKPDGTYTFIPTGAMLGLKVGEQISFDIRVWVNGGMMDPNGTAATITVTVTGTNSSPICTGVSSGTHEVLEDGTAAQQRCSGQLGAIDPDAEPGELQYTVLQGSGATKTSPTTWEGQYGTLTLRADGTYSYTLHNELAQGANVDNYLHDVFKIVVRDSYGATSDPWTLDIAIVGKNDLPVVSNIALMPAVGVDDLLHQSGSGSMLVRDVDDVLSGNSFYIGYGSLPIGTNTSALSHSAATGTYGTLTIDGYDPATGQLTYHYNLDNNKAQGLGRNDHPVERFTVLVDDGHGTLVKQEITVTVNGLNHPPTLDALVGLSVSEVDNSANRGTVIGTAFSGHDIDNGDMARLTYVGTGNVALSAAEKAAGALGAGYTNKVVGAHGTLYYNSSTGANKYVCNGNVQGNDTAKDTFEIKAYDSLAYSVGQILTVTVSGHADAPIVTITGSTVLQAANHESGATNATLSLSIVDPDAGDHAEVRLSLGDQSVGSWNSAGTGSLTGIYGTLTLTNGQLVYNLSQIGSVQALQAGQERTETFTIWVKDDTGNLVVKEVVFTVQGTNDTPIISDIHAMAPITENISLPAAVSNGYFMVTDVDDGLSTLFASVLNGGNGSYGKLTASYDYNGKVSFTYTVDPDKAQKLGAGQSSTESFTIRVTDGHGGYTDQIVTVQVNGTNDKPTMSLSCNGAEVHDPTISVVEDAAHIGASVSLGFSYADVDLNDQGLLSVQLIHGADSAPAGSGLHGSYGTLKLVGGNLVYTVDRSLGTGSGQKDTFTVKVQDAHGGWVEQTVTFDVTSYNESPAISVGKGGLLNIGNAWSATDIVDDHHMFQTQSVSGNMGLTLFDMESPLNDLTLSVHGKGDATGLFQLSGDVVHGQYGDLIFGASGNYTYTLHTDLDTLRALANSGGNLDDAFTVRVTDTEGAYSDAIFNVHAGASSLVAATPSFSGNYDNSLILGTGGDDYIRISGADNIIYGGDGDDVLRVYGHGNQLFGGAGNDLFIVDHDNLGNRFDGGTGIDFLVGLTDMNDVNSLFTSGHLENIDVVLVGNAGITAMSNLASLGLSVVDGELNIDARWSENASALPVSAAGYTAFQTTLILASGDETLTALVNSELLKHG